MLVWTDIESNGLQEHGGHLLEVALVITDDDLNEVAAQSTPVQPVDVLLDEVIEKMDPYVRDMHTKSGLFDDVRSIGMRRHEAEIMLKQFAELHFVGVPEVVTHKCVTCGKNESKHLPNGEFHSAFVLCPDGKSDTDRFVPMMEAAIKHTPMAGSTIGSDRRWLRAHMPRLEGLFGYRSVDVSSLTELAKRWNPAVYEGRPKAAAAHRALADVRESIAYLKYYRESRFIVGDTIVGSVEAKAV